MMGQKCFSQSKFYYYFTSSYQHDPGDLIGKAEGPIAASDLSHWLSEADFVVLGANEAELGAGHSSRRPSKHFPSRTELKTRGIRRDASCSNEAPQPRLQDAGNHGRVRDLSTIHHFEQPRRRNLVDGDDAFRNLRSAELLDCRHIEMNARA
jgi:hypothetical protein